MSFVCRVAYAAFRFLVEIQYKFSEQMGILVARTFFIG